MKTTDNLTTQINNTLFIMDRYDILEKLFKRMGEKPTPKRIIEETLYLKIKLN
jgi:hypothetical protein